MAPPESPHRHSMLPGSGSIADLPNIRNGVDSALWLSAGNSPLADSSRLRRIRTFPTGEMSQKQTGVRLGYVALSETGRAISGWD